MATNNSIKRENLQRNKANEVLKDIEDEDIILINDIDEIPNLDKINFNEIKNRLIIFEQKTFCYKFNLKYEKLIWHGSKACKKKNFINPEWLRSVKNKKYPIWRMDIFFSKFKYNDIYLVEEGGWHFTNIRKPEELEKKLSNFLHYIDFQESGLQLKDLEKLMKEKKIMYDHSSDKSESKWGNGEKLQTIKLKEMPKYIIDNYHKYKPWLDNV